MRMRTPTSLYCPYLSWIFQIGDIKYTYAAKSLVAHVLRYTLQPAVQTAARFLHRHYQQVSHDRDITLTTWADY